ncbi:MAG TPA: amidophosphoribosyltransferase, partial [Phycisphaerae bacterium]|nr:amidophosphoribosyltransferase [Phycisphaerae bacterium]
LMPSMLLDLQNRGQLAAGMSSYQPGRAQILDTYRDIGTVTEAFRMSRPAEHRQILARYAGRAAIGHTRYATCGIESASHAQPFERHHGRRWKWFTFAFNGQLANYTELRDRLLAKRDYHFSLHTDTEIIMHQLSYHLRGDRPADLVDVMRSLSRMFDGAYNLVFLNAMGDMIVARDRLGFRPLCYAVQGRLFAAASESVALANMGFDDIRSLEPGTMALIRRGKLSIKRFAKPSRKAHCFFEWVYFANVASEIDGVGVYLSRFRCGKRLAEQEDQPAGDDRIVVPVPDTAKAAADAFAYHLGIPSVEGLIRNRYLGRTFIQPAGTRVLSARSKYSPLPSVLEGRRVFLVEDSIVRSTTLRSLVADMRRRGGAKEIHVRVACPPVVAPCFYGIDMSTLGELFAPKHVPPRYRGRLDAAIAARMAEALGIDSLRYLQVADVGECIRMDQDQLCLGCVTGRYPTASGRKLIARARRNFREGREGTRTYE